jgi:hypothetical protein
MQYLWLGFVGFWEPNGGWVVGGTFMILGGSDGQL